MKHKLSISRSFCEWGTLEVEAASEAEALKLAYSAAFCNSPEVKWEGVSPHPQDFEEADFHLVGDEHDA